jgi:hypothetical protein
VRCLRRPKRRRNSGKRRRARRIVSSHASSAAFSVASDEQREALILTVASGLSCQQAAEVCECQISMNQEAGIGGLPRDIAGLAGGFAGTEDQFRESHGHVRMRIVRRLDLPRVSRFRFLNARKTSVHFQRYGRPV